MNRQTQLNAEAIGPVILGIMFWAVGSCRRVQYWRACKQANIEAIWHPISTGQTGYLNLSARNP